MQILNELFGYGSPLDETELLEALRRADGDVAQAIQDRLEACQAYVKRLMPAQIERERNALHGRLGNDRHVQRQEISAASLQTRRALDVLAAAIS